MSDARNWLTISQLRDFARPYCGFYCFLKWSSDQTKFASTFSWIYYWLIQSFFETLAWLFGLIRKILGTKELGIPNELNTKALARTAIKYVPKYIRKTCCISFFNEIIIKQTRPHMYCQRWNKPFSAPCICSLMNISLGSKRHRYNNNDGDEDEKDEEDQDEDEDACEITTLKDLILVSMQTFIFVFMWPVYIPL